MKRGNKINDINPISDELSDFNHKFHKLLDNWFNEGLKNPQELNKQMNVKEVADKLNFTSVKDMERKLKNYTGGLSYKPLFSVFRAKQIGLLLTKGYELPEIANICGFADPYSISKETKKYFLKTPTEIKKLDEEEWLALEKKAFE